MDREAQSKSVFATEPVGRLIVRFAIPCVISLVVNALYNIVDQIFVGWGVGYLGNGVTNVVFPITIITLALAVLIGDGGAAYLSLKLGEGDMASVKKGVGNSAVMVTIAGVAMLVITLVFMDPILTLFGATDLLRPFALEYGYVIAIGLPFTMISTALNAIIRADGSPKYAMVSMLLGAVINTVFDPIFIFVFEMGVRVAVIAFLIFQLAPMSVVSLFGSEEGLYNEFAVMCFRIFLLLCPLNGFQTVAAIYLQAVGKPVKSAIVTLARQIVFLVPVAVLLPRWIGVTGVLWAGPVADSLAFILAVIFVGYEIRQLKSLHAAE
ncbi:MAG TPA: hypothetical protein IAA94_03245 [Candidatus Galloscillospira stercoripullorum]|nr:hypothetical protein [Candidatus Galloscillospira stercoripullorum]